MGDDWNMLTVNQKRHRESDDYCGFVKTTNGVDLYNYYGYTGNLRIVCEHISKVESRQLNWKTVERRISRGIPFVSAISPTSYRKTITINGMPYSIKELSCRYGVKANTIVQRLKRGWSPEEAVGIVEHRKEAKHYIVDGVAGSLTDLSRYYGISPDTVRSRLCRHWDIESAFKLPYGDKSRTIKGTDKEILYDGQSGSLKQMCDLYGFPRHRVYYKISRYGMSKNEAFAACVLAAS